MIRECWDEDSKSFYPTACTHVRESHRGDCHPTILLSSLAFAHEIGLTGNNEHRRVFREAFKTAIQAGKDGLKSGHEQSQAGYSSRWFHFTPFGLQALQE